MEFQKQTVLEVCMLGGFSVTYQGKEILIGRKKYLKIYPASAVDLAQGRKKNF